MTNNKQQTTTEWFTNEVYQIIENYDVDKMGYHIEKAYKQAKEMEKVQHRITWGNALSAINIDKWESFDQFYKETYGGNK